MTFIGEVAFEFCTKLSDITILRSDRRSLKFDNAVFDETGLLQAEIRWEGAEVLELNYDLFFSLGLEVIHEEDGTWLLKWHPEEIGPYNGTLITEATKWDCGAEPDTVTCTLEKGGKFTVSGGGKMADYENDSNQPWKNYRSQIDSVVIEEGVTHIGESAFYACLNPGTLSISDSVKTIGKLAFGFNTNINPVTIPSGVTSIGNSAFYACDNLKSFTIKRSDNQTPLVIGKDNFLMTSVREAALIWEGSTDLVPTFIIDNTVNYEIKNNDTLVCTPEGGRIDPAELTVTVEEKTFALSVTAPEFDDVFVGYERPEAKPVSIENTGNAKAAITSVKLASFTVTKDGDEAPVSFELNTEAGTTIDVGETDSSTYTVQPVSGLEAGSYTAKILVYYDAAEPASAKLSFKVNEKAQAELQVTLSEDDPTVPQYDVPEGTISETVTYSGTLADGTPYASENAPTEPGEYTVTVTCETADTIYSGSADFTITGPEPDPEPQPDPDHHSGMDFFRLCEDCRLPATGFSALRRTILSEQPKELRYEPVRMHLMLPTLEQDLELVTVPRQGNTWAVTWLGADAGLLAGSALPGEGFSVVAAHNTLNDTAYGPFALLGTMEENDMILVTAGDGTLRTFRVYANELLTPDDMQGLAAIAEENALILVTCENESINGGYEHRRIIAAKPIL